jgi:beta-hydroxylase
MTLRLRGKPLRDHAYDAAMGLMAPLERVILRSSLVADTPFLPVDEFPWARTLEANWRDIRAELETVLEHQNDLPAFHEITADVSDISDTNWKTFFFYGYGFKSESNCRRCPRTAALLEGVPGLTTAFFSILAPGKRIPPHRGPWRGVLRYHLGLMIPDPPERCGISVGGEIAHWAEGESMIFDDCYEHAAWNDTDRTRVVLFLDVMRPCRAPGSWVNRSVIGAVRVSPFVRDAKRKFRAWERAYAVKHPG